MGRLFPSWCGLLACLVCLYGQPTAARAHVVLDDNRDRTITVNLATGNRSVVVRVAYRLEMQETTAILEDLAAVKDDLDLSNFRNRREAFFREFTRCYGPILARRLLAKLDGRSLPFTCTKAEHHLKDENGRTLGHLRCDFVFEARETVRPAQRHQFFFKENNYSEEAGYPGQVLLSFTSQVPVEILTRTAPSATLQQKAPIDYERGDTDKLRTVEATFRLPTDPVAEAGHKEKKQPAPAGKPGEPKDQAKGEARQGGAAGSTPRAKAIWELTLRDLFFHSEYGLALLLLLAAIVGGFHALTPGHGKTLVAAYLVGERGTVWHAVLLGVVTTLTHTGVVLVLAAVLNGFFPRGMSAATRQGVQTGLCLVGGLVVTCLGFWLLLRRLSGRADHFHVGGHGHHHHHPEHGHTHPDHSHPDHYHDEHGHTHPLPAATATVGGWGLVVLGMNGGIVPCWDAVVILVAAVATDSLALALPLLLAFSAGLAAVLVLVGVLVVKAKGLAGARWEESRFFRALPLVSAALVILLGLWLCYESVHGHGLH